MNKVFSQAVLFMCILVSPFLYAQTPSAGKSEAQKNQSQAEPKVLSKKAYTGTKNAKRLTCIQFTLTKGGEHKESFFRVASTSDLSLLFDNKEVGECIRRLQAEKEGPFVPENPSEEVLKSGQTKIGSVGCSFHATEKEEQFSVVLKTVMSVGSADMNECFLRLGFANIAKRKQEKSPQHVPPVEKLPPVTPGVHNA